MAERGWIIYRKVITGCRLCLKIGPSLLDFGAWRLTGFSEEFLLVSVPLFSIHLPSEKPGSKGTLKCPFFQGGLELGDESASRRGALRAIDGQGAFEKLPELRGQRWGAFINRWETILT